MNLLYGEIVDLELEDGVQMGNVRVAGAIKKVPLDLIAGVHRDDKILICDGVAIGKVNYFDIGHSDCVISNHVPGHTR